MPFFVIFPIIIMSACQVSQTIPPQRLLFCVIMFPGYMSGASEVILCDQQHSTFRWSKGVKLPKCHRLNCKIMNLFRDLGWKPFVKESEWILLPSIGLSARVAAKQLLREKKKPPPLLSKRKDDPGMRLSPSKPTLGSPGLAFRVVLFSSCSVFLHFNLNSRVRLWGVIARAYTNEK